MTEYESFADIEMLNTLMGRLRLAYEGNEIFFRRNWWSSLNEYPIFYAAITLYDIENVIECGTNAGASALVFAVALKNNNRRGKVYTYDIEKINGVDEGTNAAHLIVRHLKSYSESDLPVLPGRVLYFVDGDHSEKSCLADLEHTAKYIKSGDVIFVHDAYKYQPVKDALNKFLMTRDKKFKLIPTSCGIGVIEW